MYRRKKTGGKKKRTVRGERVTVWFPPIVLDILDSIVRQEGCSRSWMVTEAVCSHLGISESLIGKERGYEIPKKFKDRKGLWTQAKVAGLTEQEIDDLLESGMDEPIEYTCTVCGEEVALDSGTPKEVVKSLGGMCVRCAYSNTAEGR